MPRPRKIDLNSVQLAQKVAGKTKDVTELRQALSILLPAQADKTLEQTASILGVSRASVARLQREFRRRSASLPSDRKHWGGRRKTLLTREQERKFLEPWTELAIQGRVLVVSPIRAALALQLGRPVAASIVYRLLARHGWRKIAPNTRHPKAKPEVQEAWKKNSRKIWMPC
jgi:transposase